MVQLTKYRQCETGLLKARFEYVVHELASEMSAWPPSAVTYAGACPVPRPLAGQRCAIAARPAPCGAPGGDADDGCGFGSGGKTFQQGLVAPVVDPGLRAALLHHRTLLDRAYMEINTHTASACRGQAAVTPQQQSDLAHRFRMLMGVRRPATPLMALRPALPCCGRPRQPWARGG